MHLVVLSLPCIKSTAFVSVSSVSSATDGEGENELFPICVLVDAKGNHFWKEHRRQCEFKYVQTRLQIKPSFYLQLLFPDCVLRGPGLPGEVLRLQGGLG